MTNPPKISLITCTKNSGRWLADCLASVKAQTVQPFEHIFIDTASTDNTLDLIKRYNPQATIYNQPTTGLYSSLNAGLQQAQGDIVGFLHSDDALADPEALSRIAKAFTDNPELGFYCSRMEVYDEKLQTPFAILGAAPHKPTLREELYSSNYFAHPTYYCSRDTINKAGLYNEQYAIAGDIDWLMRLEKLKLQFYFDPKTLVKFRSASGVSSKKYLRALAEEFSIVKKYRGLSLRLLFIYSWHAIRRLTRLLLEKLGLHRVIQLSRKKLTTFSS